MKRKPLLIVSTAALLFCGVIGFLAHSLWVKEASLLVVNHNPHKVVYATFYRPRKDKTVVSEFHELNPGEQKITTQKFWGVEPNFAVFAHSADPELIRWVRKLAQDNHAIVYYDEGVEDEAIIFEKVRGDGFYTPENSEGTTDDPDTETQGFVEAPFVQATVDPHTLQATYPIQDNTFTGLYDRAGISSPEEEITVFSARAEMLASALQRQMKFDKRWPNPDRTFPYRIGLVINDHNGRCMPGVAIEAVAPMTIRGDAMPIHPGDVLVKFGDGPLIFSELDLHLALFEHATSYAKGIEVPIPFEVIRDGQRLKGQTMYFFNEAYWGYSDADKFRAAAYGFGDGVTIGHSVGVSTGAKNALKFVYNIFRSEETPRKEIRNFKEEIWEGNQDKERLRQMYSNAFNGGAFVGTFCPGPGWFFRLPLARSLTRVGASKAVASIGAAAMIEVAEGVVWTVADASPLQKPEDTIEDVKTAAAFAAGSRIMFGTLTRRMPR